MTDAQHLLDMAIETPTAEQSRIVRDLAERFCGEDAPMVCLMLGVTCA